jgi:hypothetical protein
MKFLLFNFAVAAALVFLFTADRSEVQKIAGQVHDAAGDMKAYANKALNSGQNMLDRGAVTAGRNAEPAPAATPRQLSAQPAATPSMAQPEPPLSPQLARNLPAMPEIGTEISRETSRVAVADLEPAVAKRRKEVLDGIEAADTTPALKEGARLMTPSERRRELVSLAEEMELLYARSISQ